MVSRDEAKSLQVAMQCKLKRTEIKAEQNQFCAISRASFALQNQGRKNLILKTEMHLKGRKKSPRRLKQFFRANVTLLNKDNIVFSNCKV